MRRKWDWMIYYLWEWRCAKPSAIRLPRIHPVARGKMMENNIFTIDKVYPVKG